MRKEAFAQKREDLRREQILEAALQVFAEKGFQVARMQEVANAAGVSNGTVYNYFRSKDEVLLALLAQLAEREQQQEVQALPPPVSLEDFLINQLQRRYRGLRSHKELWRVVLPELITNPNLRQKGFELIFGPVFDTDAALLGKVFRGKQNKALAEPMLRAVAASVLGLLTLELLGDEKTESEADSILALVGRAFAQHLEANLKP